LSSTVTSFTRHAIEAYILRGCTQGRRGSYCTKLRARSKPQANIFETSGGPGGILQHLHRKINNTEASEKAIPPIHNKSSAVAEMGDRLVTIDMGRKVERGCCGGWVSNGSPSNTVWPGPRPTSLPSGILIHPTVWPQL